jgi:hypothetical protein
MADRKAELERKKARLQQVITFALFYFVSGL